MRKLMLVFLMLFLPLQWTAALAADCCLRHAEAKEHHAAQMHDEHHAHHAKADQGDEPGKQSKTDCGMNCADCHVHQCAAAVFDVVTARIALPLQEGNTPYISGITSPVPDNLFRPPLHVLA